MKARDIRKAINKSSKVMIYVPCLETYVKVAASVILEEFKGRKPSAEQAVSVELEDNGICYIDSEF